MIDDAKDKLLIANNKLLMLSNKQGFVTFDDIIEVVDSFDLSFDCVEKISGFLLNNGVIIKEKEKDDVEIEDRSQIDYSEIYREILQLSPESAPLIEYAKSIIPAKRGEVNKYIHQAKDGNKFARNRILDIHFRVALKDALYFCKKYQLDFDETVDWAIMGIMRAIDMFDPYKMGNFSTYAPFWIKQHIYRYCHFYNKSVFYPVHTRERLMIIYHYKQNHHCPNCPDNFDQLCNNLVDEISQALKISPNNIRSLYKASLPFLSLDDLDIDSESTSFNISYDDSYLEEIMWNNDLNALVNKMLSSLKKPQYVDIIERRFGLNNKPIMTLEEIGRIYGLTRERIRQIIAKEMVKMRNYCLRHNYQELLELL